MEPNDRVGVMWGGFGSTVRFHHLDPNVQVALLAMKECHEEANQLKFRLADERDINPMKIRQGYEAGQEKVLARVRELRKELVKVLHVSPSSYDILALLDENFPEAGKTEMKP